MFDDSQNQPSTTNLDTTNTQSNDANTPSADNTSSPAPSTFPPVSADSASTDNLITPTSPPTIGANDSSSFDPSVLDSVMNDTPEPAVSSSDTAASSTTDTTSETVEDTTSPAVDDTATPTDTTSADDAPATPSNTSDNSGLLDIKQQALQELSPLVSKLDQNPEEKFRTTMMMIQASDDHSLVNDAFESAKNITDDKARAQALLDVINEINYFSSQSKTDQE